MHSQRRARGFALPEIYVSIIAVLIGIVVPPLQDERIVANQQAAEAATLLLRKEVDRTGGTSVPEIVSGCLDRADCPLSTGLEDAVDGGYIFYWDAENGRMEAWPAVPGLTGMMTITTIDGVSLGLLETPGAEENLREAFRGALAGAGDVIGALLANSGQATALQLAGELPVGCSALGVDGAYVDDIVIGAVGPAELLDGGASLLAAASGGDNGLGGGIFNGASLSLTTVGATFRDALALGAGDENLEGFFVIPSELPGCDDTTDRAVYFSYGTLRTLTRAYIEQGNLYGRLATLLDRAERRAARGDVAGEQEALQRYVDALRERGVFEWITRNHQVTLEVTAQVTASPGVVLQ